MGSYGDYNICPKCGGYGHHEYWYHSDSYTFDCKFCGYSASKMIHYEACKGFFDEGIDCDGYFRSESIGYGMLYATDGDFCMAHRIRYGKYRRLPKHATPEILDGAWCNIFFVPSPYAYNVGLKGHFQIDYKDSFESSVIKHIFNINPSTWYRTKDGRLYFMFDARHRHFTHETLDRELAELYDKVMNVCKQIGFHDDEQEIVWQSALNRHHPERIRCFMPLPQAVLEICKEYEEQIDRERKAIDTLYKECKCPAEDSVYMGDLDLDPDRQFRSRSYQKMLVELCPHDDASWQKFINEVKDLCVG